MKLLYSILVIAPLFLATRGSEVKYILDTNESVVTWKGWMQLVPQNSHTGFLSVSEGELMIENGGLVGGKLEVDMTTMTDEQHRSDNNLIDHLKSPDFFDVAKFPASSFVITKVAPMNGETAVTGNLTIKGITHAVTFPVTMEVDGSTVNAHGKFTIDRIKWDVSYGSGFFGTLANEAISDNIDIDVKIVARKK